MSMKVKESTIVCPANETPRKSIWLSNLDMIFPWPYSHIRIVYIYRPNKETKIGSNYFDTHIMKESLSKVLVPFYPVAGRLKKIEENGRYEIDCNATGVLYEEVETTHILDEFKGFKPNAQFRELVMPWCDYSCGLASLPLMMVRVTRFKRGGVCIGFGLHHQVADGIGHIELINSWARLARGFELTYQPIHDRAVYLAARNPPQVKFQHIEYEPTPSITGLSGEMAASKECLFELSKCQIDILKLQAMSDSQEEPTYKLSTFEVLAGHVWRSMCKARGLIGDQDLKLYIPTDGRTRMKDPTLPRGYYGNAVFITSCIDKGCNITGKPLCYVANKVHESLRKVENPEYLRSSLDYLELHLDLTKIVRVPGDDFTSPYFGINSWGRIPFYEADFGWGKQEFVGRCGIKIDGQAFFIPSSKRDGSISLNINLSSIHMPLFEKFLYEFESLVNV